MLVIDDEPSVADVVKRGLELAGFAAETSPSGTDGIVRILRGGFALVLLDWRLGNMSGGEVIRVIRGAGYAVPVLVLSGYDEAEAARAAGAEAFVRKPFDRATLLPVIERLLAGKATTGSGTRFADFSPWTTRAVALIDRVGAGLSPEAARLDRSGRRDLLRQLGRALVDSDITIPEFLAGGRAFKAMVQATRGVDRSVLAAARRLVALPPLDRGGLHDKVCGAIDCLESAGRAAHPLREGLIASDLGIASAHLGKLLRQQTNMHWDDWSIAAHLRDSVRGLATERRPIGVSATTEWGWSSRHQLYDELDDLLGVGPRTFRAVVASTAGPSRRTQDLHDPRIL